MRLHLTVKFSQDHLYMHMYTLCHNHLSLWCIILQIYIYIYILQLIYRVMMSWIFSSNPLLACVYAFLFGGDNMSMYIHCILCYAKISLYVTLQEKGRAISSYTLKRATCTYFSCGVSSISRNSMSCNLYKFNFYWMLMFFIFIIFKIKILIHKKK